MVIPLSVFAPPKSQAMEYQHLGMAFRNFLGACIVRHRSSFDNYRHAHHSDGALEGA